MDQKKAELQTIGARALLAITLPRPSATAYILIPDHDQFRSFPVVETYQITAGN